MLRVLFYLLIFVAPTAAFAQSYCVKTNGVDLFKTPGGESSWKVGKYMPLQGTGKKQGAFVQVKDVDGQLHWVKKNEVTTNIRCLVVKAHHVKMRSGPGKDYSEVPMPTISKYSPYKDLGGEDGWTQVEDDFGNKAWINLDSTWKPHGERIRMSFENE